MTNQPERGETYGSGHPPDLAVASLTQLKAKPAGWNRTTLPNRRIGIGDCLGLVIRKDPCFGWTSCSSLNGHSRLELVQLVVVRATLHLNPILTPVPKARIGEPLLQPTVISEQ